MNSEIKVKYFYGDITPISKTEKGDWIDLRCVGAYKIGIHNTITMGKDGFPTLERKTTKSVLPKLLGFLKEDGYEKEVEFFSYKKGDFLLLDLGIAMELPQGYEANVVPRSSTFKSFTLLQTNSFGVIDESYKGDTDKWFMPVLAMQDGFIIYNERLCQFRINKKMDTLDINTVESLENENRGGHGSSGNK